MDKLSITITGGSGSGLLSTGEILIKAFKKLGFYIHAERNYPSLIKGGHSSFQIVISNKPVNSLTRETNILIALDNAGIGEYLDSINNGGFFIHGYEFFHKQTDNIEKLKNKKIKTIYIPGRATAKKAGGNFLVVNMILLGVLFKALDLNLDILYKEVEIKFANKPKLLEIDKKCIEEGYKIECDKILSLDLPNKINETIVIDGNTAIALGAIHAGVRAFYAYPMSPASSILTYLAKKQKETEMIVKQAEDEITACQMTIGSMQAGTRAFTATSGGGFDLMTESVSLAGMIESPLVVVIAQRPGPATGLPTWTAQGDLDMAIYSSHGEFPKVIIAVSNPSSAFKLTQHAFNIAEKYQVPVILLSEKTIAEAKTTVPIFKEGKINIERGLVDKQDLDSLKISDRFEYNKSGISKRWVQGDSEIIYYANGDEHKEDGTLGEDAITAKKMADKRTRKFNSIKTSLPEPKIYGNKSADISFVGWGSSKNVMLDTIEEYKNKGKSVNYLHFKYLWPLKTGKLEEFFQNNNKICLIEGNARGQLGGLIEKETNLTFYKKLLKYDGRPFYMEDVSEFIEKLI